MHIRVIKAVFGLHLIFLYIFFFNLSVVVFLFLFFLFFVFFVFFCFYGSIHLVTSDTTSASKQDAPNHFTFIVCLYGKS